MSCSRFCEMRVPGFQRTRCPSCSVMWLRRMVTSMAACKLDTGDLSPAELRHVVDVVYVVVLNDAEHCAHAADDPALLAVVDVAATDDVAANFPSAIHGTGRGRPRRAPSGRAFYMLMGEYCSLSGSRYFAERNAGAFAVIDFAVFYDPPLAPVRPYHSVLESSGRSPGGSSFGDFEPLP